MAAPPPSRWADLTTDMATEIANRLPCEIDRVRMAGVCKAWLAAVAQARPSPPLLPKLLLAPADATGIYCYLSGFRDHNRFPGPRHFGSYDGGWLFLAYRHTRDNRHRLLDIRTGESHDLPYVLDDREDYHSIVFLAATLSLPPDHQGCVAAGIVNYQPEPWEPRRRHFAFWRLGNVAAICDVEPAVPVGPGLEPEDVVFHRGAFHFLTQGGHILVCTPTLVGVWPTQVLVVTSELLRFQEEERSDEQQFVRARYLVESHGELLMVVRLAPRHDALTSSFKVFRMATGGIKPDGKKEEAPWTWIELPALGGRMLFVGRGCSKSYETAEYPGFKDGIFFLDDRSFYDDEMMFRGVNERQYPCSDTGRWSPDGPPHVHLYFPHRVPSYNSPPGWLLP